MDWLKFRFNSDLPKEDPQIKGLHRGQLMLAMFAATGYTFKSGKGFVRKDTGEIIADKPQSAMKVFNDEYKPKQPLTLEIINNYNQLMDYIKKNPAIKRSGMVSKESAEKLETTGETPNTWAQDVSPSLGWVYKEWEDPSPLKNIVDKLLVRRNEEFWIHRDNIEESEQDDKIRIVFWFDN
jgi:hypothetical protein